MVTFKITPQAKENPITYSFFETAFGICLVASTEVGICNMLFADTKQEALQDLQSRWRNYTLTEVSENVHQNIKKYFTESSFSSPVTFHLIGTPFQAKVWQALFEIEKGSTATYKLIAEKIGNSKSVRAVGTAIGANPIGYIIPCHRVLRSDGGLGGFRWGIERKKAMLAFEQ